MKVKERLTNGTFHRKEVIMKISVQLLLASVVATLGYVFGIWFVMANE